MKCKCIDEVKEEVKKIIMEKNNINEGDISRTYLTGETFLMQGGRRLSSEIVVEYKYKAKTSGRISNRRKSMNMLFSYCPFCGEKVIDNK